jgi:RNA recognition motif-containing protein
MSTRLYVGNLSFSVTDHSLQTLFTPYGQVASAQVIMDRDSGRSKGFGFVEMSQSQEAEAAIKALNGMEHEGRPLTVNEARARSAGGPARRF